MNPTDLPANQTTRHRLLRHGFPIAIVLGVTLIGIIGSDAASWLRYDRNDILSGQFWRVITGHFVHLNWGHLGMNLAGLVLIWALFGKYLSVAYWLLVLTVSCLLTSAGLLLFNPQLQWYVGLSGVLHGLFIVGSIYDIKSGRLDAKLLLLAVCLKLVWEQVAGPLPGSESTAGGNVIVDAHLYGAVSGAIIALGFHLPRLLAKKAK